MITKIAVENAVGHVVAHDLTKIVPDGYKGPGFRKGHIITAEDIPHLLDIGKSHINVIEMGPDELHEEEAVTRMAKAVMGPGLLMRPPSEGRVNIVAEAGGLLKINKKAVDAINRVPDAILSTLHTNHLVQAGDMVAAVKVVPLVVKKSLTDQVAEIARAEGPVAEIKVLSRLPMGFVIVGSEVFHGRIQDRFAPILKAKAELYGMPLVGESMAPDDVAEIKGRLFDQIAAGAKIVIAAGGMSVDADDLTPSAIRATGAKVVSYGTPVLPGGMFMLARLDDVTVIGLPACGMSAKNTVLDLLLPRILAGETVSHSEITALGYGGLCRKCPECRFPICGFGKN